MSSVKLGSNVLASMVDFRFLRLSRDFVNFLKSQVLHHFGLLCVYIYAVLSCFSSIGNVKHGLEQQDVKIDYFKDA